MIRRVLDFWLTECPKESIINRSNRGGWTSTAGVGSRNLVDKVGIMQMRIVLILIRADKNSSCLDSGVAFEQHLKLIKCE